MNILEELYLGRISPSERTVKSGSDYQRLAAEAADIERVFHAELSAEGKQAYDAFVSKQTQMFSIEIRDMFITGYRLGMKLLLAALTEFDTQLPQYAG